MQRPVSAHILFAMSLPMLVLSATAQEFTAADSGWVRIFNGVNFDGLYSRTYGGTAPLVTPPAAPYSIEHAGTDTATIRVGSTSPQGNIGTLDTTFSHYRMRVEAKFDAFGTTNAGLVYHTRESAIRMQNNWPRSIEFQFKQDQTGSGYSIQQVAFTTRTSSSGQGASYNPNGNVVNVCEIGCNGRWYRGNPFISTRLGTTGNQTRWLRYELVARGADSATHIVNDTVVFALWNIRIFNDSTRASGNSTTSGQTSPSNFTPNGPHGSGGLALQAEGTTLRYRRWEIMQFPAGTPKNEPYLHRLFLDVPYGRVYHAEEFRWRSIGTIPWVRIEQRSQGGEWSLVADSLPNTGSYTVGPSVNCHSPACMRDFRISGPDYVWGDSTVGRIGSSVSGKRIQGGKQPSYSVRGGVLTARNLAGIDHLMVTDLAGRAVRTVPVAGDVAEWSLTDAYGERLRAGVYLVRFEGRAVSHAGRIFVE